MTLRGRELGLVLIVGVLLVQRARADSPPFLPTLPVRVSEEHYGTRVSPLLLLQREDVARDLRLSIEQYTEAHRTAYELYTKAESLRGRRGPDVIEARKAIDEDSTRWIESNLTQKQQTRLAQIDLQWEGLSALVNRPLVVETLGLTEDQRKTIRATVDGFNEVRARKSPSAEEKKTAIDRALGVLSSLQSKRWEAMLGHPFIPKFTKAEPAQTPGR
jgi:hypothetical protein